MFQRHTVIRKVYEMQGGGYPFTHISIYIYVLITLGGLREDDFVRFKVFRVTGARLLPQLLDVD